MVYDLGIDNNGSDPMSRRRSRSEQRNKNFPRFELGAYSASVMTSTDRIHFLPLESNPDVFNTVTHSLGATNLEWHDVISLDEPDLLALIPRPILAIAVIFSMTGHLEAAMRESEALRSQETIIDGADDLIWFKQTIHNACGTYAILHAVSNGLSRDLVDPSSDFGTLIARCKSLNSQGRCRALEESAELRAAHEKAAVQGDTAPPESAEDEVDYHYICLAPSTTSRRVYELDGSKKGPIDTGVILGDGEDMLSAHVVHLLKDYITRDEGNAYFNFMALVSNQ